MPGRYRRAPMARGRSSRRRLVWATSFTFDTIANNANVNHDLLSNLKVAGSSVLGCTVVRTHMRVSVQWPNAAAVSSFYGLALGLCVQSMTQVAANTVDLAQDEDWALRDTMIPGTGADSLNPSATVLVEGWNIDLRAKRKVQELNQTWCLALSLQNAITFSIPVAVYARTLVALP